MNTTQARAWIIRAGKLGFEYTVNSSFIRLSKGDEDLIEIHHNGQILSEYVDYETMLKPMIEIAQLKGWL